MLHVDSGERVGWSIEGSLDYIPVSTVWWGSAASWPVRFPSILTTDMERLFTLLQVIGAALHPLEMTVTSLDPRVATANKPLPPPRKVPPCLPESYQHPHHLHMPFRRTVR